jgi:hypothetical protein
MKPGQIVRLQELKRCWIPLRSRRDKRIRSTHSFVFYWESMTKIVPELTMGRWDEANLRRLWHAYRGQIAAMRKNRKA